MGENSPFKNQNRKVDVIEVVVVAVDVARMTVIEGVEIAAEVIPWRGLSSMDTRMSLPHSASLHTLVSTSVTSVVSSKPGVLNMITSPSINGD